VSEIDTPAIQTILWSLHRQSCPAHGLCCFPFSIVRRPLGVKSIVISVMYISVITSGWEPGSLVSVVSGYGLDDRASEV
jgi:hypothetical protein